GREAMESRLAMVVRDLDELVRSLRYYLARVRADAHTIQEPRPVADAGRPVPMFTANLDEERSDMALLLAGDSCAGPMRPLLAEANLEKLALYWAQGGKVPWAALHADGARRLLALPAYPFARERYWVQSNAAQQPGVEQRPLAGDEQPSQVAAAHRPPSDDPADAASGDGAFAVHPDHSVRDNMQRYLVWFLCKEAGLTPDQVK